MKKFSNDDEVVLVMSQREFVTLDVLVAAGVCYENNNDKFNEKDLNRFRAIRDQL